MSGEYLSFTKGYLENYLEGKLTGIKEEIDRFDEGYILNASEEDLTKSLVKKYMSHPPTLKLDKKYLLKTEKGKPLTVVVPFEGEEELFYYRPSQHFLINLQSKIHIYKDELHLEYTPLYHSPESLKSKIEYDIQQIQQFHLNLVKKDVDNFNNSLENHIINLIKTKKDELLEYRNFVSSLGIPIKEK